MAPPPDRYRILDPWFPKREKMKLASQLQSIITLSILIVEKPELRGSRAPTESFQSAPPRFFKDRYWESYGRLKLITQFLQDTAKKYPNQYSAPNADIALHWWGHLCMILFAKTMSLYDMCAWSLRSKFVVLANQILYKNPVRAPPKQSTITQDTLIAHILSNNAPFLISFAI